MGKKILDACCGNRMFWFDKHQPDTLFIDNRTMPPTKVGKGRNARTRAVQPDKVMDFRKLDLPDNQFSLVVFDPPHFNTLGANSYTAITYGRLDPITWKSDLSKGFAECFRVLKPNGVLIFKWNEYDISVKTVLALTPVKPLFGHIVAKTQRTHWICFMKPELLEQETL